MAPISIQIMGPDPRRDPTISLEDGCGAGWTGLDREESDYMASSMATVAPMEEPTAYYEDMDAVSDEEMAIFLDACHALLADVDADDRAPDDAERCNSASLLYAYKASLSIVTRRQVSHRQV